MRLIDVDAMDKKLFFDQVGGKDSLITAEKTFEMIEMQPTVDISEIKSSCIDELLKECLKFKNQYKTFYYSDLVDIAKSIKEKMY